MHGWMALIGISVLTTWQHHFVDVLSGAAVGTLILYTLPMPDLGWRPLGRAASPRLGLRYLFAALACAAAAVGFQGWAWMLLWPAVALALVGFAYLGGNAQVFQKHANGHVSIASRLIFLPYRLGVHLTRRFFKPAPVSDMGNGVLIGCWPAGQSMTPAVLDLCAELPSRQAETVRYASHPMLDLTMPSTVELNAAAAKLDELRQHGAVLVHCALGWSRSAHVVAHWLVRYGYERDLATAWARLATDRPGIVPLACTDEAHP
ncbi:dual specificity protein phosphatase family protein [Chitinibacteraceae bacterium HSL-7]